MMDNFKRQWPCKHELFGINVSGTVYRDLLYSVVSAAKGERKGLITHLATHGLIEGSQDESYKAILNNFNVVAPDGQPVRLALNWLYKLNLPDRCYGPRFMLLLSERAVYEGIRIYLYGSYQHVVEALRIELQTLFPGLHIVGAEPSTFRPLTLDEDDALVRRINESGAQVVFIGLGCPLQEKFAYEHKDKIHSVQICVGAAFDFISGNKKMAPPWIQNCSLEWLFRLAHEPHRLAKRYFTTNTIFLYKLILQIVQLKTLKLLRGKGVK